MSQERWKVTAEQAKAESIQRGLEEEKRSLTMHINMEREELERAKVRSRDLGTSPGICTSTANRTEPSLAAMPPLV